jgi:hypothetical protein
MRKEGLRSCGTEEKIERPARLTLSRALKSLSPPQYGTRDPGGLQRELCFHWLAGFG